MSMDQIQQISEKMKHLVRETEESIASAEGNNYIETLFDEELDLEDVEADLSDAILTQIQKLQSRGIKNSHVLKLLKRSASPKLVSLDVVSNEIASVIPKKIEVPVPSDIARMVKRLDDSQFKFLKTKIEAHYPTKESNYVVVDCSFDRWALIVNEDKFVENVFLFLSALDHED